MPQGSGTWVISASPHPYSFPHIDFTDSTTYHFQGIHSFLPFLEKSLDFGRLFRGR
jgi:hypothetical protein